MRVDVFFGAHSVASADVAGRVVVVIDVLRASTTIAVALANGARTVIPFESSDEVVTRAKAFERAETSAGGRTAECCRSRASTSAIRRSSSRATAWRGGRCSSRRPTAPPRWSRSRGARRGRGLVRELTPVAAMLRAAARAKTDVAIVCAGRSGSSRSRTPPARAGSCAHHPARLATWRSTTRARPRC